MSDPEPKRTFSGPECETLRELLPAYSIGATDADETRLVESLLERCPEQAAELAEYMLLSGVLLARAAPAQPPARLHDRLMAAASAGSGVRPVDFAPAPTPARHDLRRALRARTATMLAAAAALLIATNLFWLLLARDLNSRRQDTLDRMAEQNALLVDLLASAVQRVELSSQEDGAAFAAVLWSADQDAAMLVASYLPPLEAGRIYQLWLVGSDGPISAGLFSVNEQGRAMLLFHPPAPLDTFQALGISNEPESGSDQPTTDPVVVGEV